MKPKCTLAERVALRRTVLVAMLWVAGGVWLSSCSKDEDAQNPVPPVIMEDTVDRPLEIVSTEDVKWNQILTQVISSLSAGGYSSDSGIVSDSLVKKVSMMVALFTERKKAIGFEYMQSLSVRYYSTGVGGEKIQLSGRVYIPVMADSIRGIIIANHYTYLADREAPSNAMQFEALLAPMGYVVVMSDYIGFGATRSHPQTFMAQDITAQSQVDLELAVYQYLKRVGGRLRDASNTVSITGFSQGGAVAVAVHRLIENRYADLIRVRRTFVGAAPYNLLATYKAMVGSSSSVGGLSYAPLTLLGLDYAYGLNTDFTKVFKGRLLAHYHEWYESKELTDVQIRDSLNTTRPSDIFTPEALDPESEIMKPFVRAMKLNSLIGWLPRAPMLLYHSTTDDVIPFAVAEEAYASYRLSSSLVVSHFGDYGGHPSSAPGYYVLLFEQL